MAKLSHVQEMGLWTRENPLAEGGVFRGKENIPPAKQRKCSHRFLRIRRVAGPNLSDSTRGNRGLCNSDLADTGKTCS